MVRSGQEPAEFGGIGDRIAERLPWLHDQAGACAGGWVAVKGVIHATFSNRKGVLGGGQPGPG